MTHSKRTLLNLWLLFVCILTSDYSLAETIPGAPVSHACGNADSKPAGPDFGTFRALATTAVDSQPAPTAPTTRPQSGVQHASHSSSASPSENVRRSPAASRIPAAIVTDSDVATIRLVTQTEPAEAPSRFPVPEQPINIQPQPKDLLSRLTADASKRSTQRSHENASEAICAIDNAPEVAIEAQPFSGLSEEDSRGVPKHWDISTRRAKVVDEVGNGSSELAATSPRLFAPTPNSIDLSGENAKIGLASASIPVASDQPEPGTDVPFWVQPSLLGKVQKGPEASQQEPVEAAIAKPNVIAEFRIEGQATQQLLNTQTDSDTLVLAEFHVEPTVTESNPADDGVAATAPPADDIPTTDSKERWATMPVPGRPEDMTAKTESTDSKLEPRRWAGLFVPQTKHVGSSKSHNAQVSFDAPVADSTVPADNLLAQADKPRPGVRRRMRLNFLDDPQEAAGDPTREAIKSILDSDEEKKGDPSSSLLDDLEDDPDDYRERYRYAFEDVIEPKPIKKIPRNYTASLKDIFADEEPNPAIEQAFCGLMWSCAGGKCMSTTDRMKRDLRRNYALFQSPCGTPVCRPMDGFEERVRGMMQTVPANTPALSPFPAQSPILGLPRM